MIWVALAIMQMQMTHLQTLTLLRAAKKPRPKAGSEDVIQPPNTMTVDATPQVVLYDAYERPLKRQIGYRA